MGDQGAGLVEYLIGGRYVEQVPDHHPYLVHEGEVVVQPGYRYPFPGLSGGFQVGQLLDEGVHEIGPGMGLVGGLRPASRRPVRDPAGQTIGGRT